jgi:cytochrome c2
MTGETGKGMLQKLNSTIRSVHARFVMPLLARRISVQVALLAVSVALIAGIATEAFNPSPYALAQRGAAQAMALIARVTGTGAKKYKAPSKQDFDTALLPLQKEIATKPAEHGAATVAGGIAPYGNDILIVDRLGAFFRISSRGKNIETLSLPKLPNNAEAYLDFAGKIKVNGFRVHNMKARREAKGHRLFVSFEKYLPDKEGTALALATILLSHDDLSAAGGWETLYESTPLIVTRKQYAGLGGGGAVFVTDDTAYVSVGDYNRDGGPHPGAQDKDSDLGTIVAVDLKTKKHARVSLGHRNPQGIVLHSGGQLYATEHGPKGGDELNAVHEGKNYGWPYKTYGVNYTNYNWGAARAGQPEEAYEKPVYSWVPSIGPTQIVEGGAFHKKWRGDLLVGSLKAQSVFRLHLEDGRVVYDEPIFIGERVRDLAITEDGTLVLWTDQAHLIFVNVDEEALTRNTRVNEVVVNRALTPCMTCHHVGLTTPNHSAPTLSKVYGRKIAADGFERYTDALKGSRGEWTAENLYAFLTDPQGFAPGTAMPYAATPAEAYEIIDVLKKVD